MQKAVPVAASGAPTDIRCRSAKTNKVPLAHAHVGLWRSLGRGCNREIGSIGCSLLDPALDVGLFPLKRVAERAQRAAGSQDRQIHARLQAGPIAETGAETPYPRVVQSRR